jgi:hypothetical protein
LSKIGVFSFTNERGQILIKKSFYCGDKMAKLPDYPQQKRKFRENLKIFFFRKKR